MQIKDTIKIYFFPKLIRILHKLGFSYEKLGKNSFFSKSNVLAQAKDLAKMEVEKTENPQTIYVLLMLSGSTFHLYIESLLALGLKKKGHKITFIIDDNTLPIHELKRIGNEKNWDYEANKHYAFASKYLDDLKLKHISVSEFIKDANTLEYKSEYDYIVEATLLKQYKVGTISNDLPLLKQKLN